MTTKSFWETKSLLEFDETEWESLCDGCGRCCLRKLEDEDTGKIVYTDVACRLLDASTCRCGDYAHRLERVADCARLEPGDETTLGWMPTTCAYRLVAAGRPLPEWHPLISGTDESVHEAGISVRGRTTSEEHVHEDELVTRIVDWIVVDD